MNVKIYHKSLLPKRSMTIIPNPKPLRSDPLIVARKDDWAPFSPYSTGTYGLMKNVSSLES